MGIMFGGFGRMGEHDSKIYMRIGWDKVRRSEIGSEVPIYKKIGLDTT